MIAPEVLESAKQYADFWNDTFIEVPYLRTDFTWMSLGVVELTLLPVLGKEEFCAEDEQLIHNASAYIAIFGYEVWGVFATNVEVSKDKKRGVVLSAINEQGEVISVSIEQALRDILKEVPRLFPVIADFSRFVSPDNSFMPLFGLGLVMGLSPFANEDNTDKSLRDYTARIDKVVKFLATQCASYYAEAFPDEPLGQVAELYLDKLIFPPLFMEEPLPACVATEGLLSFCKAYNLKSEQMIQLTHNLALMPDELISFAGLVFHSVIAREFTSAFIARCRVTGSAMSLLRYASLQLRQTLGGRGEWVGVEPVTEVDAANFDRERMLGYIPWVSMHSSCVAKQQSCPKMTALLKSLVEFDISRSISMCEYLVAETPNDIDLRLQRISLELAKGEIEDVKSMLRSLATEPEAETDPCLYNLWGMVSLITGEHVDAVRYLERAMGLRIENLRDREDVLTNYSRALWLNQQYSKALNIADEAMKTTPMPLAAMVNKVEMLRELRRFDESSQLVAHLVQLAPYDTRVFVYKVTESLFESYKSSSSE